MTNITTSFSVVCFKIRITLHQSITLLQKSLKCIKMAYFILILPFAFRNINFSGGLDLCSAVERDMLC